jgi:choline dehydrogenase-like flavoprotein
LSSKETIISCGALDTPKLLLISGIGPKAHLSEVGVDCKVDLPGVGSNLKDHPLNIMLYKTRDSLDPDLQDIVVSFFRDEKLLESAEAALVSPEDKRLLARPTVAMFEVASAFNFPPGAPVAEPNVAFFCIGMAPQSTGTVRLASANPLDAPLCDPKFHSHQYDRKTAVSAIREVLDIVETGFNGQLTTPISAPASKSDDSINSWLNDTLVSGWHMSSSVKMGVNDDKTACVDSDFKLRGLNGLRVADMSVCPFLPNGHTASMAYLVGFWAAERIAKDYNLHI